MKIKFNNTPMHVHCDICRTRTETKSQTVDYPYKGKTYRFENVELEICPACGFTYYPSYTLLAIEKQLAEQTTKPRAA